MPAFRPRPKPSGATTSPWMYAAGGAAGTFGLSTMFGGLFGGGSGGGIADVIQLLPLVIIGGGILYAVTVFKK